MRVRVLIEKGPDQGRCVEFTRGRATIGRGPATNLSLTDPALNGHIIVWFGRSLLQVRNETQNQILLRPKHQEPVVIERFETRPWPTNERLQLTNETILKVEVDSEKEDLEDDEFILDKKGRRRGKKEFNEKRLQLAMLLFLVVATPGYLWLYQITRPAEAVVEKNIDYDQMMRELNDLSVADKKQGSRIADLKRAVEEARFHETAHRPADAYRRYESAREDLDRLAGTEVWGVDPSTVPQPLQDLRRFLNDRIIALSRHRERR